MLLGVAICFLVQFHTLKYFKLKLHKSYSNFTTLGGIHAIIFHSYLVRGASNYNYLISWDVGFRNSIIFTPKL